ncbi:MFS transporter [Actinomadura rupiterrae]|uniref:MFS transporter n=1 Tax=Actinomadura rupiterrae TaxID=559627 RepID=UPI0020A55481|nr:MFS transporter [Actinomadura rupiterrae]MCP2339054.1 MFS family permease [Actinomadura rupiterrae]
MTTQAPHGSRHEARPPGATAALALPGAATLLGLMNYTAPIATLTDTADGLHAGTTARIWVMSSISLGLAAALLVVGALADDHGRRRVFALGGALLALSSIGCALAPNSAAFVAGRIVQGVATAALLATGLGIIGHTFTGHARARAAGIWGAMLGLGIALGPIAAAWLTQLVDWRLWYWVTVVASLALTAASRALPESRAELRRGLDIPGLITMVGGVSALLSAVTLGRTGWTRPTVLALLAAAIVLLIAFVAVEARRTSPMLDLGLFRRPAFLLSIGGALVTGLAVIGLMSNLVTIMVSALRLSPLAASFVLGIWSGLSYVAALQARRLPARWPSGVLLGAGLALSAVGELAMLGLSPGTSWTRLIPGLVIAGVGSGLANAMLARLAVDSVPPQRAGMGSGANNTARYTGAALGVAMVFAINTSSGTTPHAVTHGLNLSLIVSAILCAAGALAAIPLSRRAANSATPTTSTSITSTSAGTTPAPAAR